MTRAELLEMPDYWIAHFQISLYDCAERFMKEKGMNRAQLAEYLGVTKGYVSQLLNGNFDHKISKLVDLALKFGYVPKLEFQKTQNFILEDSLKQIDSYRKREYFPVSLKRTITMRAGVEYAQTKNVDFELVA